MKTSIWISSLVAGAFLVLASSASPAAQAGVSEFRGDIIDGKCLANHQDDLKSFLEHHAKQCALASICSASGFNLVTDDGTVLSFDRASNDKVSNFLEKKESKLKVVVTASQNAEGLYVLSSIKNQ